LKQQGTEGATAALAKPAPASQAMNVREIRWFGIPIDQYEQFKKDLAAEASIESEKTISSSERDFALKSNRELLIKVIIVSPAER
jgi:hypothetical protein